MYLAGLCRLKSRLSFGFRTGKVFQGGTDFLLCSKFSAFYASKKAWAGLIIGRDLDMTKKIVIHSNLSRQGSSESLQVLKYHERTSLLLLRQTGRLTILQKHCKKHAGRASITHLPRGYIVLGHQVSQTFRSIRQYSISIIGGRNPYQ